MIIKGGHTRVLNYSKIKSIDEFKKQIMYLLENNWIPSTFESCYSKISRQVVITFTYGHNNTDSLKAYEWLSEQGVPFYLLLDNTTSVGSYKFSYDGVKSKLENLSNYKGYYITEGRIGFVTKYALPFYDILDKKEDISQYNSDNCLALAYGAFTDRTLLKVLASVKNKFVLVHEEESWDNISRVVPRITIPESISLFRFKLLLILGMNVTSQLLKLFKTNNYKDF